MKIEKINDSQIRCILTKSELEKRDLKLSEIAYGSAKVKKLFQDMMQLAYVQCGFEADNIPLAIEVIPFRDYASIIVTKVKDPEELDTRYSRFSPSVENQAQGGIFSELDRLFRSITGNNAPDSQEDANFDPDEFDDIPEVPGSMGGSISIGDTTLSEAANRYYYFDDLEELLDMVSGIREPVGIRTNLYKSHATGSDSCYLLEIDRSSMTNEAFENICSYVSEFGSQANALETFPYFLLEHYELILRDDALNFLKQS